MNPRAEAMLTAREQTASNNEGYARLEAIRPLQRKRRERVKRSLWAWFTLVVLFPGSWAGTYFVAEFVLHLLRVPHWH